MADRHADIADRQTGNRQADMHGQADIDLHGRHGKHDVQQAGRRANMANKQAISRYMDALQQDPQGADLIRPAEVLRESREDSLLVACLLASLLACLPASLHACMHACLPACLPCLPTCLLARRLARLLFACLLARLPAWISRLCHEVLACIYNSKEDLSKLNATSLREIARNTKWRINVEDCEKFEACVE